MKKYIIKDSQGNKKTIYAENITHALSYVEDSKAKDAVSLIKGDWFTLRRENDVLYKVIDDQRKTINGFREAMMVEEYQITFTKDYKDCIIKKVGNKSFHPDSWSSLDIIRFNSAKEAMNWLKRQLQLTKHRFDSRVKDVEISFDKRIKKALERGKLHDFTFNGSYAMKASKAEFPELKQELEKRKYKNIMFCNNPYNRYNVFFKDEASSVTTINALVNDEKAAIDSYNVAIKNLEEKIDEKAMQVLINIRNDERRHIENLYSILNGQVTEKNLEDSKMKDSKYYVGISTHGYTKEQAERDARKFGLQLKIAGKSRDPHFEYDAYFIGPRNNILKMLKANDLEEFEEDIEDSVHDAKLKESNGVYYKLERGYWNVLSIHNDKEMDHQDVITLARKNNVIIEPFFKHDYHSTDKGGYYYTDYRVKGKDKNAVIRFCEAMNPRVKPLNFEE